MAKQAKEPETVEIVVATYWPTRIVKSVSIKEPGKQYRDEITLSAKDARYVYQQLHALYGEVAADEAES